MQINAWCKGVWWDGRSRISYYKGRGVCGTPKRKRGLYMVRVMIIMLALILFPITGSLKRSEAREDITREERIGNKTGDKKRQRHKSLQWTEGPMFKAAYATPVLAPSTAIPYLSDIPL